MWRKKTAAFVLVFAIILSAVAQAEAVQLTIEKVRTKNEEGVPEYLDQLVTVQGIAAVNSGLWHDSANYFSLIDATDSHTGILVYLPGTTRPQIRAGNLVQVTGKLAERGYATDVGSLVIVAADPASVQVIDEDYGLHIKPRRIATDAPADVLDGAEGGFVQIEGRLFDYSGTGIVRGFWLDGSGDGNIADGQGSMYVKFYNYAGIDISDLHNGSYVVVVGILLKADERHGGYYIRPVSNESITELPDKSVAEEFFGPRGLSVELGTPLQLREYGLIELISLQGSLPLAREMYPEWHPDSGSLIFTMGTEQGARISREAAEQNLYVYRLSSTAPPQQLTFACYPHAYPRWSPDGQGLLYAAAPNIDEPDGNWQIFYWDLQTEPVAITAHPSYNITPTWSPDGRSFIFASNRSGRWDLWWQDLEGSEARQLSGGPEDILFPDWSESGLLFQKRGENGRFDVWKAEVIFRDGSPALVNAGCLTEGQGGSSVYPRWSPKQDRIAFMSSQRGQWDIWLMDSAGANKARLTKYAGNYMFPAWHPNGRRLACTADLGDGPSLYMLDIAGALAAQAAPLAENERSAVPAPPLPPNTLEGPIRYIVSPLLTQPKFVYPGQELVIGLRDVPGQDVKICLESAAQRYEVQAAPGNNQVAIRLPEDFPPGLYDLYLYGDGIIDTQLRAVAVIASSDRITFALVTDVHPEVSYSDQANELSPILEELNGLNPDFVVLTGDLMGRSADNYAQDYAELYALLKREAKFPFFLVMGNHDGKVSGSLDGFAYWQSFFGELYYTFDFQNCRFLAINTYDHPPYPSENGFIHDEQLGWLETQLIDAQEKGMPTIAFLHHNPFDTRWKFIDEGQKELRDLLEVYGVSHVFAGHRHSDQLEQSVSTTSITTKWVEPNASCNYRLVVVDNGHVRELHKQSFPSTDR